MPTVAQVLAHIHPNTAWFTYILVSIPAPHGFQLSVWMRMKLSKPPSAQSPFARLGRYLRRGSVLHYLEGHYPFVSAHTGSCARPNPSRRFQPYTTGLRRLSPVPAGRWSFPTLSLQSLRRCLDPYPAMFPGCPCPFLPQGHRPHVTGNTFGTQDYPCIAASTGSRIFGAAVIRLSSGSHAR